MNRIGIFIFYDKDGIVDDYNTYFLQHLRKHFKRLVIVVNGNLNEDGHQKLSEYSNEILIRENIGWEIAAYKHAFTHIGYENLADYDELLMFNNTCFGPLSSFDDMFETMEARTELDFWGITKHEKLDFIPWPTNSKYEYDYIPEHLQSYFLIFKKNILKSPFFVEFWDTRPEIKNYFDSVGFFELPVSQFFKEKGFAFDSYINCEKYYDLHPHPLMYLQETLIKEEKCPVIKRRNFFHDNYNDFYGCSLADSTAGAYQYILEKGIYPTNLIWKNILRTANMKIIHDNLQLNYVVNEEKALDANTTYSVGVVVHIYYSDQIDFCFSYLKNTPEYVDILLTTNSEENKLLLENALKEINRKGEVQVIPNRGRDISALLVAAKDFVLAHDFICFYHDKKSPHLGLGLSGKDFARHCLNNLLISEDHIQNILKLFNSDKNIGVLCPPLPIHAEYQTLITREWTRNYKMVENLLLKWNLKVPISSNLAPIAPFGTMFWFRTNALAPLFNRNFDYTDFDKEPLAVDGTISHAIERIFPFIAQSEGFYSANIYSQRGAKTYISNINFLNRKTIIDSQIHRVFIVKNMLKWGIFKWKIVRFLGRPIYRWYKKHFD